MNIMKTSCTGAAHSATSQLTSGVNMYKCVPINLRMTDIQHVYFQSHLQAHLKYVHHCTERLFV